MLRAVLADVFNRLIQPVHHFQAQDERIPLLIEILRPRWLDNPLTILL